jgi:hypothetical protein
MLPKTLVYSTMTQIVLAMRTLSSLLSCAFLGIGSLQASEGIVSRNAKIGDVQLHYLTAGNGGAAVILWHGRV